MRHATVLQYTKKTAPSGYGRAGYSFVRCFVLFFSILGDGSCRIHRHPKPQCRNPSTAFCGAYEACCRQVLQPTAAEQRWTQNAFRAGNSGIVQPAGQRNISRVEATHALFAAVSRCVNEDMAASSAPEQVVGHDVRAANGSKVEGLAELEGVGLIVGLQPVDSGGSELRWHTGKPARHPAGARQARRLTSSCPVTNTSTPPLRLGCASSELMWCLHC